MTEFNLVDEPWIPCIDLETNRVEYGIRDTLLKAHELREICDDSPLITIAVHRLLLAVLYRALGGPGDFRAWKTLYSRSAFDPQTIDEYLDKWRDRFDIFDGIRPFYQMAGFETKKPTSVSRLATECANGNNATLFDHSEDEEEVNWSPSQAAKHMIACQAFALGFGKSGNAKIGGKDEALPYFADGIALRGMNVWLQGVSLFETFLINLVPVDEDTFPPWELENANKYRDRLQGKNRKTVSAFGIVDRFTWQSRLVRLIPNGSTVSKMHFAQGRSADKSAGDPMKIYRRSTKEGISALPLSGEKAAWRNAHAILTIPSPANYERRPECFNLAARACSDAVMHGSRTVLAQIVGLASAPNKAGKLVLWRHERMPVPAALLGDENLIERLGGLLQCAEAAASSLRSRTWNIAKYFQIPADREPTKNEKEDIKRLLNRLDPRPAYWARLEKYFFTLIENLPNDWDSEKGDWKSDDEQEATRDWRDQVKREAQRALEEGIRSLGTTARAIRAIARVRTDFSDEDLKP